MQAGWRLPGRQGPGVAPRAPAAATQSAPTVLAQVLHGRGVHAGGGDEGAHSMPSPPAPPGGSADKAPGVAHAAGRSILALLEIQLATYWGRLGGLALLTTHMP